MRHLRSFLAGVALSSLLVVPIAGQETNGKLNNHINGTSMIGGPIAGGRVPLRVGESRVLENVASFDIADPAVVSAKAGANHTLILTGRRGGHTTLLVRKVDIRGLIAYEVSVSGSDVDNTLAVIKAALGGIIGLHIHKEGNVVVIEGDVVERDDGKRIDLQRRFFGDQVLDLTRRLYLVTELSKLVDEFQRNRLTTINASVQMGEQGQKVLVLRGAVFSEQQKATVLRLAGQFFEEGRIVENIYIDSPQIEVDIEVYAFDLQKARSVGHNDLLNQITRIQGSGWTGQSGPRSFAGPNRYTYPLFTWSEFQTQLSLLDQVGAVTNISTQHVSVRSGEKALVKNTTDQKIRVEGAFDAKLEDVIVGQTLEIAPVVLDDGRFETKLEITLSELVGQEQTREEVAIATVERVINSVFVSGHDETVVLGGSKRATTSDEEERTPFLGRIPIVNLFFRAKSKRAEESVNVYFMTLRSPTVAEAEGDAQSQAADDEKQKVKGKSGGNQRYMERRLRRSKFIPFDPGEP